MQTDSQVDQITQRVKILERVPREKRMEVFHRGTRNIYVIGSIFLLVALWAILFGETIIDMGPLWDMHKGFIKNSWNLIANLFFPVVLPCVLIIGIPLQIRNYRIKKIVEKEYPEHRDGRTGA